MSFDWTDAKERVRQAIDIVELVGDYLQLRREGRGYKALCPWHDDSRPSLQVNPERQSFKCWVCDIGGDIFSFIMKMEGVEFAEALQLLADKAGITIERRRRDDGDAPATTGDEKRDMLQALAWAEQRFHAFLLNAPEAEPARRYLAERGITQDSIHQFHCGYSPNSWDWLVGQARQTAFSPKLLAAAGLIGERQNGPGYYDRFRGRVLFSIRDAQSRPVGFGGRVLPGISDDSPAKYVNSPETPLFQKSSLLYGLDHAKDAVQRTGTVVVMEGYTDVVIAHQCGFKNATAVLGTALGERHIKLLKRFADRVILMLDGDEAGQKRTDEVLGMFVAENVDLRILTLPDELDPADFLLQRGADEFARLVERTHDALEHKYRTMAAAYGGEPSMHQRNEIAEAILDVLAKPSQSLRNYSTELSVRADAALARLHSLTRIPEDKLRRSLAARRRALKSAAPTTTQMPESQVENAPNSADADLPDTPRCAQAERWLMEILIHSPEWTAEARQIVAVEHFRKRDHRAVFAAAVQLCAEGILPDFDRLMLAFDEPRLKSLLIDLDESRAAKKREPTLQELHDLARVLVERDGLGLGLFTEQPDAPAAEPSTDERSDDVARLRKLLERERTRQGISVSTDG